MRVTSVPSLYWSVCAPCRTLTACSGQPTRWARRARLSWTCRLFERSSGREWWEWGAGFMRVRLRGTQVSVKLRPTWNGNRHIPSFSPGFVSYRSQWRHCLLSSLQVVMLSFVFSLSLELLPAAHELKFFFPDAFALRPSTQVGEGVVTAPSTPWPTCWQRQWQSPPPRPTPTFIATPAGTQAHQPLDGRRVRVYETDG